MYGPRRRAVYSPFARFEFLVFLIPLFFFIMAFVVISMTIMPDPHANKRPQGLPSPPALQPRTALKAVSSPSSQLLCGHSMAGVAASDWADYCGGAGGFVCRSSRELIDSVQVNDDFCDCADGSDEVGTSACSLLSSARFTCKTQQQVQRTSAHDTSSHSPHTAAWPPHHPASLLMPSCCSPAACACADAAPNVHGQRRPVRLL